MAYSAAWQQYYNNLQDQHLAGAADAQARMGVLDYRQRNRVAGGAKGQASYYGWDWDQDARYRHIMDLEARGKAEMEQITANLTKAPRRKGVAVNTSISGHQWYDDDQAAKDASVRYARAKQAAAEMQHQRWQAYQAYANAYAPPAAQQPAPRPQASVSRPPVARQQAPRPSQPAQQQYSRPAQQQYGQPAQQQYGQPAPQQPPPPAPAPPAPSQQGAAAPVPASTYAGWKPSGGTAVQKQKSWEGWLPPSMRQRQQ